MSVSIDGKYSIDEITRESFANQAEKVHLGKRAAMNRFDRLQNGFEKALNEAAYELKEEGFRNAEMIREEHLLELVNCHDELDGLTAYESFRSGFLLGAKLIMAVSVEGRDHG